ncbi:hypothetical protein [Streptococcus merionis]|nr:hypothetical protein [Streptococcus merionis]
MSCKYLGYLNLGGTAEIRNDLRPCLAIAGQVFIVFEEYEMRTIPVNTDS